MGNLRFGDADIASALSLMYQRTVAERYMSWAQLPPGLRSATLAYAKLPEEEKVAVRLRYGDDIVRWWNEQEEARLP